MIRINLMPRDEVLRRASRRRDRTVGLSTVAVLLALVVGSELVSRRESRMVDAEASRYRAELAELNRRYQQAIVLERKRTELRTKLETIASLERQRRGPVRVLDDLGGATPDKLWLTEMRENGGSAVFLGRGLDNQTVAVFMRNLERSPYFSNVELVETRQVEDGLAKLKEFSIRTRVSYAGSAAGESDAESAGVEAAS
jgi:type IV pilus assembly protein PilN